MWVCQPGQKADPCTSGLGATAVTASGALRPATWPRSALASKFDCFYVHPTDSLAKTANTGPAPLAHTGSTPIILVGDSQGSAILIHLISARLDHEPSERHRLLAAILVGGNLQVPEGKTVGATFTQVPLCTAATQTGCAIAFSSYPSEPPADSVFGRPGQGTSLQSGQTAKTGQQVACVNPAALGGGTGDLDPYLLTATQTTPIDSGRLTEPVSTPWVTYPGLYSARCRQGGGATWLQVTSLAGTSRTRPVVNDDDTTGKLGGTGPAWGYHGYEYWLTLGNLLRDIAAQETAWQSRH